VSGGVYHGEQEHLEVLNAAFDAYSLANPLHADLWPSAVKYESEVIAMTADLLNGGDTNVCGCMTSGGTESIILAAKTHRDYYRTKGVSKPEIVACVSAHAAIDKACDLLGIRLIKIPMKPETYQLDVRAMEAAIGPNTIMLYASAPTFPQGVIDDVEAVGKLARKYDTGLHVDCCLGGFVLPFAKKLGYPIPNFDFGVPGVTSMSVDTHKVCPPLCLENMWITPSADNSAVAVWVFRW
jgi:glutamate/tyrosine decarboxylase-like PLP-dependent enzyme